MKEAVRPPPHLRDEKGKQNPNPTKVAKLETPNPQDNTATPIPDKKRLPPGKNLENQTKNPTLLPITSFVVTRYRRTAPTRFCDVFYSPTNDVGHVGKMGVAWCRLWCAHGLVSKQ